MDAIDWNENIFEAQKDSYKLNKLIEDSQPFIKRCVSQLRVTEQSQDDALTIAMLTFANCIKVYRAERGSFLSFVYTAIRNKLIDDYRSEQRFELLHMPLAEESAVNRGWETKLSVENYQEQLQKTSLQYEIEELSEILCQWKTSFVELTKICPKQKRTRAQCAYVVTLIMKNKAWKSLLFDKHKLPKIELCRTYGISKKFLEKYKKYIAVLCVIESGDYPMLQTFLPTSIKESVECD